MQDITLSVVIPSYNEPVEMKIEALDEVNAYLSKQDYSYEVILVDDGSTNGSLTEVKEHIKKLKGFRVLEPEHGGKALTVMAGMLDAKGVIALFTDLDQATPIDQLSKILPKFEEENDIVIGSRSGRKGAPLTRKFVAWGFAVLRNLILGLPYSDTQCGFKAFNRVSREEIFGQMQKEWKKNTAKGAAVNASFDIEALYIAKKKGYKVAEVPVKWHHVDVGSRQVRVLNEAIDSLKAMFKIRWNSTVSRKYS
jgi:dolichyl-phosphate beta-glucosyltransferase